MAKTPAARRDGSRLLLRQPTVSKAHIAFLHAGDLWLVDRAGGEARRLTAHPGGKAWPMLSPDGQWLAYSCNADGRQSVHVLPVAGGDPRRLTFHAGDDQVRGWTPDGQRVVFASTRDSVTSRYNRLWSVAIDGGYPRPLPMPMAERGAHAPDGKRMAYTRIPEAFWTWKRYRGGQATPILIFDLKTHDTVAIPHAGSNDSFPCWVGGTVYFMSDRAGCMNVFAYDARSRRVTRATWHEDFDVRSLCAAHGAVVYEQAGRIHLLDTASGRGAPLDVRVAHDAARIAPRFVPGQWHIRNAALSPSGSRAVFETRGEILTVPAKKGDLRNLTNTVDVHERDPAWSPDGSRIAYFSDRGGEYRLVVRDQKGLDADVVIDLGAKTFFHSPVWSPDGARIAYTDKRLNLFHVAVPAARTARAARSRPAKPVLVDTDTYDHIFRSLDPCWSPDGAWLAYTKRLDSHLRAVFIHQVATGVTRRITDGLSDCVSARFSLDGKHLFFAASVDFGLNTGWLDMSSYQRPVNRSIYVTVLAKGEPSPLEPESDDEAGPAPATAPVPAKAKPAPTTKTRIDFAGIEGRTLALPMPARDYHELACAADGRLFYLEAVPNQDGHTLHRYEQKERKAEPFLERVHAYRLSQQGRHLLWCGPNNAWAIVKTDTKPAKPEDGALDLAKMQVRVDPKAEWRQMFDEAWRIQRDYFYDAGMHGLDWNAIGRKYRPFVELVTERADLDRLICEMISELVVGHAYVWGGDRPGVEWTSYGLLGADYDIVGGSYRFARIYRGLNWHPELRSPLTGPGIEVAEGEYLVAVDGEPLREPTDVNSLFAMKADRQTVIEVNRKPTRAGARRITVVPVGNEAGLRHWAWVEGNRRLVDKLSRGRVAYVYMPDTSVAGYSAFNRYYFSQLDRQGVVLDERFNGGGSVADYIIDKLGRPLLSRWATREGKPFSSPNASIFGPKAMVINEFAGSGGDAMPLFFKRRGLGKLIGTRTWGGLVGIYDYPALMDGGVMTAPRMAIFSPDGRWEVENVGVAPDIEVEMTPKLEIAGRDPQLERAVRVVLDELEHADTRPVPRPRPSLRARGLDIAAAEAAKPARR